MGRNRWMLGVVLLATSCQFPVSQVNIPQENAFQVQPEAMQFELQGQTLNEANLADFLVQNQHGGTLKNLLTKIKDEWYHRLRPGDRQKSTELVIQDVQLSETGQSILGKEASGFVRPDFAGQVVLLTIKGKFQDRQKRPLGLSSFQFTLEPELVQQTFVGLQPKSRVLLDHSVLLDVESVSASEIKAKLNTQQIPDLYLKGLHRLSVEYENYYTDALVRIGEPEPVESLIPIIESVEVMRERRRPLHLRLRGKRFMVYPKFSYTTIDGQFGFGYQTEVLSDGSSETIVHIPNPDTFDQQSTHTVVYHSPFGSTFKIFTSGGR